MSWSKTPPTEEGFFWCRKVQADGRRMWTSVVHLMRESDGELHCTTATTNDHVGLWPNYEWWSESLTPPTAEGGT